MQCVKSIFVSNLIVTLCFKFIFMEIMNTCWRIWISESFIRRSGQLVGTCLVSHIFDRATPFFYRDHDDAAVIYLISHVYVKEGDTTVRMSKHFTSPLYSLRDRWRPIMM